MVTDFKLGNFQSHRPLFGKIYTNFMQDIKKDNNMCKTYFITAK